MKNPTEPAGAPPCAAAGNIQETIDAESREICRPARIDTNWRDMLRRMAIEAAESKLFSLAAGMAGPVGTAFSFLGFGGGKASGGPVYPGNAYVVGEHGPEMFVPHAIGQIVPNGGKSIVNNIDARGATDPAAVAAAVQRAIVASVNISDARVTTRLALLSRPRMA